MQFLHTVWLQDDGKRITATLLNVLMRAIARNSDTTTAGKVFNAYEATWGLQPDVDTYNAVLESCEAHGKLAAVQGMMGLMSQREVTPNTVSWNLLLSTAIRAGAWCEQIVGLLFKALRASIVGGYWAGGHVCV